MVKGDGPSTNYRLIILELEAGLSSQSHSLDESGFGHVKKEEGCEKALHDRF